jgi:glycosyltransferase involved in cell wall biosynthesis
MMRFHCVTPCFNAENYIELTMLSVLNQTALKNETCSLTYIIQDGGSSDTTIDIVKQLALQFSENSNITIEYFSKKDKGMYDALANGLEKNTNSDIYSYINAGDLYSPHAFEIMSEIFGDNDVNFITGLNTIYNEKNHVIDAYKILGYNKNLLQKGFYGTHLYFVQQESTFWSGAANKTLNFEELRDFKYAGDFYLWHTFNKHYPLFSICAWLSGFKIHHGQLSATHKIAYVAELRGIAYKPTWVDYIFAYGLKILTHLPNKTQKKYCSHLFEYDHSIQKYRLQQFISKL